MSSELCGLVLRLPQRLLRRHRRDRDLCRLLLQLVCVCIREDEDGSQLFGLLVGGEEVGRAGDLVPALELVVGVVGGAQAGFGLEVGVVF